MLVENTIIEGLKLIHIPKFSDKRGDFIKVFNFDFFKGNGLETNYKENYFSVSGKNVIRGMHFQIPPAAHSKLVYLSQGAILDVVLDIRKKSSTYGQYYIIKIEKKKPIAMYIPVGCAHGFLSLSDNTIINYLQTSPYNPECDKGVKYDSFGLDWEVKNPIISQRDQTFPEFKQFNSPF